MTEAFVVGLAGNGRYPRDTARIHEWGGENMGGMQP